MMGHASHEVPDQRQKTTRLILWCFLGILAFYLLLEHWAHLYGILPYILLLICPLLHFLHGGHGGHGKRSNHAHSEVSHTESDTKSVSLAGLPAHDQPLSQEPRKEEHHHA